MANKRWTEAQTIKFVQLSEEAECLWNFRHALYKNKDARDAAARNLISQMNLPNFDNNDLKNKIKNIRSTYVQEVNKIKRAIKSGMSPDEAYVSHLPWFTTADRFLKEVITTREHFSNHSEEIANSGASQLEQEDHETEVDATSNRDEMNACQSNTQGTESIRTTLSSPSIDLTRTRPMEDSTAISTNKPGTPHGNFGMKRSATPSSSRNVKQKASKSNETPPQHIASAIQSLQDLQRSVQTTEDEFSHFAKNVASQLRQLPLDRALDCQTQIMILLANQRTAAMRRSQYIYTPSESPSTSHSCHTNRTGVTDDGQYQCSNTDYSQDSSPDLQGPNTLTEAIRSIGGFDAFTQ